MSRDSYPQLKGYPSLRERAIEKGLIDGKGHPLA